MNSREQSWNVMQATSPSRTIYTDGGHHLELEERLRQTNAFLENLINCANVPVIVWDLEFRIIRFNHAFESLTDRSEGEVVGRSLEMLFPPVLAEASMALVRKTLNGERLEAVELQVLCRDESVRSVLWNSATLFTPDGQSPLAVIAQTQDITERAHLAAALRDSECLFKEFQRAAFIGSYKTDLATGVWKSSEVLDQIFGIDQNYERTVQGWLELVHPYDREGIDRHLRETVIEKRKQLNTEYRIIRHSDGQVRWVHSLGEVYFYSDNKDGALMGAIQDITERKRAEEALRESELRFRMLVENSPDAHLIIEDGIHFADCNQAALDMLRLTDRAQLFSMTPMDLSPDQQPDGRFSREKSQDMYDQVQAKGSHRWEWVNRRADGELFPMDVLATAIPSHGKMLLHVVWRDITERKQAEAEIKSLNTELEQRVIQRTAQLEGANKEMEAFSYSISHDLRAPLRGIDGWSLALLEDYGSQLDEQAHTYMNQVRSEAQRMSLLIDDLLELSRVTRAEMRRAQVDMSALAHTVAGRLKDAEPQRAVEFVIQPDLYVQADARLLEVVLTNLIGNAFKFTSKTSPARIECGLTDVQGQRACFVRDNGVGFDMAHAHKLFSAFKRMHSTSEFPGIGIGLATVQRVIRHHGGQVWAEAQINTGATFYFTLGEDQ